MLTYLIKLLKALGANSKPSQIANSFCIGFLLGLMPKDNLLWYLLLIFFMFVRINKAGYFIMMILGAFISPYFDPIFHQIGEAVLTYEPLVPTFAKLLEIPFVGFTRFNNTIVCGSLVAGIIAYIPLFLFIKVTLKPQIPWQHRFPAATHDSVNIVTDRASYRLIRTSIMPSYGNYFFHNIIMVYFI